jgi:hypothetical protein
MDVLQILNYVGLFFDCLRRCKVSPRINGVVIPEKCGKSRLASSLEGSALLIDLDEMLKQENLDLYTRALKRNDYNALTIQLADDAKELIKKLKNLYRRKRITLITSRIDLLDMLNIKYIVFIPSNNLFETIKSGLSPEDQTIAINSRMCLIQCPHHNVFNSWDELSASIQNKFNVHRKLF